MTSMKFGQKRFSLAFVYIGLVVWAGLGCEHLRYADSRTQNSGADATTNQNAAEHSRELQGVMLRKLSQNAPKNYLDFIRRHQSPDLRLDEQDLELLRSIQEPQAGSTAEAVLGVGILKKALHSQNGEDLETIASTAKFDFATAFEMNPILSSHYFSAMTKTAVNKSGLSSQFYNTVRDSLEKRAQVWSQMGDNKAEDQWASQEHSDAEYANQQYQAGSSSGWYGDIQRSKSFSGSTRPPYLPQPGERVLDTAIKDQDNGRFADAVHKLNSIKEGSKDFKKAQAVKKSIESDRIRHLRKLAADAYRNALPLSNPATKYAYLKEAKGHLVLAMRNYPQSEHTSTLEDNLNMIEQEISALKTQVSASKDLDGKSATIDGGQQRYNLKKKTKDEPKLHQW